MNKKILCAVAIFLFFIMLAGTVHAPEQETIDEKEFETRFSSDSEALRDDLETNSTVVVPAPDVHECRFAILWKKVTYENGRPVSGAEVTLASSDYGGTKVLVGFLQWKDPPVTTTTNRWGSAAFIILWDSHPPESIKVTIMVSKDGYSSSEVVELKGNCHCYQFKCIHNIIRPPPTVPEFGLATPISTSIGAVAYFLFRRRREGKA
jgi:hypothetical protein